jgi:hypothetical protein
MRRVRADVPDHDAATLVAFETAVEALPPLTRVVFLLHRVDDLSYDAIARRLSIGIPAVESGLADALQGERAPPEIERIGGWHVQGRPCCGKQRWCRPANSVDRPLDIGCAALSTATANANALLSRRYRRYCEGRLHALGISPSGTMRR